MSEYPEPVAGALILNPKDEIFLMQSPKWEDKWLVPGGHVEHGETVDECVKREVKEETDLEVHSVELLDVKTGAPESFERDTSFVFLDYLCRTDSTDVELDNREATNYVWIKPRKALEELDLNESTREFIQDYLAR